MADTIALDINQVTGLIDFAKRADYPGGYDYISSIIRQHPEFDQSTAFWFDKARYINQNIRSDPADVYIRSATACGLRWDSKLNSDSIVNAKMLQATSDNIARAVLGQVIAARAINTVNTFLNQDIIGALASGQTIGGWGGAFYYWDAPFTAPGTTQVTTVGAYILSHPPEYEKFIACNAAASLDAIWETQIPGAAPSPTVPGRADAALVARAKLILDGLAVSGQAQAPQYVKDEIQERVARITTGGSAAGSPDHIGDFTYNGGRWFEPRFDLMPYSGSPSTVGFPTPVRDPNVVRQLDARRQVRQRHEGFTPVPGG